MSSNQRWQNRANQFSLGLSLLYHRYGMWPFVAAALFALFIFCCLLIPGQRTLTDKARSALQTQRQNLAELKATPESARRSPTQNLSLLIKDNASGAEQIRQLMGLAQTAGLTLTQADFRRVGEGKNQYTELQISLPLKGSYPAIRQFIYQALAQNSALSLDQLILRREANGVQLDGQLLFSLWQRNNQAVASAGRNN